MKALTKSELDKKLAAIAKENEAALNDISAHFGAERWTRLVEQALAQGLDHAQLLSLCGKMRRTRKEWHADNAQAALIAAAHGLLISLGSVPSKADEAALEAVLNPAPPPAEPPAV